MLTQPPDVFPCFTTQKFSIFTNTREKLNNVLTAKIKLKKKRRYLTVEVAQPISEDGRRSFQKKTHARQQFQWLTVALAAVIVGYYSARELRMRS